MNGVRIVIETQNDVFQNGNHDHEVARILRGLADTLDSLGADARGYPEAILYDYNGNRVGRYCLCEIIPADVVPPRARKGLKA